MAIPVEESAMTGAITAKTDAPGDHDPQAAPLKLAAAPLKATAVAPVNALPVNVTEVPTGPLVGVKELITGVEMMVKALVLVPVPEALVTLMAPEVAPAGTVVVIRVSETTVKVAAVPWKATAVVPVKLLPDSVTLVSGVPLVGEKELTTGAKLKLR